MVGCLKWHPIPYKVHWALVKSSALFRELGLILDAVNIILKTRSFLEEHFVASS